MTDTRAGDSGVQIAAPGERPGPQVVDAGSAEAAGRWRALLWIALATLLAMSTWFAGTAVVRPLREAWRLTPGAASWLTISVQLGFVTGSLVAALTNLLDVMPLKAVLVAASLGAALVNACFTLAPGPGAGIALRFATGFFLAGVYPTGMKLMATWFVRNRGRALGIMVGSLTLGSAAPYLVNAFGGVDWRRGVLWSSLLTMLGCLVAAALVREGPFPFPRARFNPAEAGRVLRNRGVRLACMGYFGHMWELYAMWAWFLVFFSESLRAAGVEQVATVAGAGTFVVIGTGLASCWWAGSLSDRWGRTSTTVLAMAVSGACSLTIGFLFGGPSWLVFLVALVWGASVIADSAQFSTMVTELSDPAYVGTALTLQLGIGFTLTVATIWLIPILSEGLGWRWAFAFLAPGPLVGIAAMLRLRSLPEARRLAGGKG